MVTKSVWTEKSPLFCIQQNRGCSLRSELRFAGQVHAQTLKGLFVGRGEDNGGMDVATTKFGELLHGQLCRGVGGGADGQGDEDLIGVQTGIAVTQMVHLQVLNGIDDHGGDQV